MSRPISKGSQIDRWEGALNPDSPIVLIDELVAAIGSKLEFGEAAILRHLVNRMRDQTEWIWNNRSALHDEAARVKELGLIMRQAGLRSYTDKEGRIYVAAPNQSDER